MIEWALCGLSAFFIFTRLGLINKRMEFLLFPSMRMETSSLENTAFLVLTNKSSSLPVYTKFIVIIRENVWLSSKILPVMSIVTLSLIVFLIKRTPFSLEVKHIEVIILGHLMDKSSLNV